MDKETQRELNIFLHSLYFVSKIVQTFFYSFCHKRIIPQDTISKSSMIKLKSDGGILQLDSVWNSERYFLEKQTHHP